MSHANTPTLSVDATQARSMAVEPLAVAVKFVGSVGGWVSVPLVTVMTFVAALLWPPLLLATRLTVYVPAAAQLWLGFWAVNVVPSPKSQFQLVALPVLVSVNATEAPTRTLVAEAVNAAVGVPDGGPWV